MILLSGDSRLRSATLAEKSETKTRLKYFVAMNLQNSLKQGRRKKTRTSELYEIAEKNGTEIICCELPETASVSVRSASGRCYIGIDPFEIETTAEERVHIAHEIGHCETFSFYNAYSPLGI